VTGDLVYGRRAVREALRGRREVLELWATERAVKAEPWLRERNGVRVQTKPERELTEAAQAYPRSALALLYLAKIRMDAGDAERAGAYLRTAVEREPGNAAARFGVARCRIDLGELEEARRLLDTLLSAAPRHGPALMERGRVSLQTNQPAEAEKWLRKAVALLPYERTANYLLGQCLQARGKREEARAYLAEADRIAADLVRLVEVTRQMTDQARDPALYAEAGQILMRNGQEQQGLRWLATALRQDPGHRPAHQALADYYRRQGDPGLAAHHQRLAQQDAPPAALP
jgi:predicted Zn-dependent protease